jgi:hypothetical protein
VEEVGESADGRRVHVVRRLVEDDEARLAAEAGPDVQELELASREAIDAQREERAEGLGGLGVCSGQVEELVGTKRHVGVSHGALALVGDGEAVAPHDLARMDPRGSGEGPDERRLAAAVRADEGEDVAGVEVEGDGAHDGTRISGNDGPVGEERLRHHFPDATAVTQRSTIAK